MLNDALTTKPEIVIIGSGNVATHISRWLDSQTRIRQIFSRNIDNASRLAESLSHNRPDVTDSLSCIYQSADLYIVAVKDDAIAQVGRDLPALTKGVVVHTSGSAPDDALGGGKNRCGVLYPLQTFSRDKDVDWSPITIFTYAFDDEAQAVIDRVAAMLNNKVKRIDGNLRSRLHIAAVFACNFANYMWIKSDILLKECGCTLADFAPLLQETLDKAVEKGPAESQTGPARRGDTRIIEKHIAMLDNEEDARIYRGLSADIMNFYGLNNKKVDNE